VMATNAFQAVHAIGMPEGRIVLAQAVTYLACSEKSNRSYLGIEEALEAVRKTGAAEIPYAIRNAPTAAMKEWGYGADYQHAHTFDDALNTMECLPDNLRGTEFYQPTERGVEQRISQRLKEIRARRKAGP